MTGVGSLKPAGEFRAGLWDITPLALGVAIYGVAFGVLAAQAGMDGLETGVMGMAVFAGSSQIVAVERMAAGSGAMAALAAGIALNLRLLLITASLREELQGRPWWQIVLGVHLATDENWALMHRTRAQSRPAGY
ncbi:MAG: AzlC family ABC transporter permease [Candidatus Competibacterales bacterium]